MLCFYKIDLKRSKSSTMNSFQNAMKYELYDRKIHKLNEVEKVYYLNKLFGNDNTYDEEKIITQAKNLYDELDEYNEAVRNNDRKEMIDAYGDLLTFCYGLGFYLNYEPEESTTITVNKELLDEENYSGRLKSAIGSFINEVELKRDVLYRYQHLVATIKELGIYLNVDSEVLMSRITKSNITKLCLSNSEMEATVRSYENLGVDIYAKFIRIEGDWFYVVHSSKEQIVRGKQYRNNKFLKSIYFEEPDLHDLV